MAIDYWRPEETDSWVKPQKIFYSNAIHIGHPQLRHLISSPSPNIIYFVDGRKVFCLDTTTNTRVLVTDLAFDAICTASGYGWFCAGGDSDGYFAALQIPDIHKIDNPNGQIPECADRPPLLDQLDAFYHALPPQVQVEKLGEQIVNSISIHRLPGTGGGEQEEVVAVLTNNDYTVRIYSLTKGKEIHVEKFGFAMNHATISPDGTMLMIVGDKEIAYFYRRTNMSRTDSGGDISPHGTWALLRQIHLHKPPQLNSSSYFTTAWSWNGKFCATASENGTITLIETEILEDELRNPIVTIVSSSRPDSHHGGVRAMCFAPYPWDLLVWNEDRGRICIADLRNRLGTYEVVNLDQNLDNVIKSDMLEGSLSTRVQRGSDVIRYTEMLRQASAQRQRQRYLNGNSAIGSEQQGLTEEEQQILDGLRTTRQREETLRNTGSNPTALTPRSINYSSPRRSLRQHALESYVLDSRSDTRSDPWRIIEAAMQPSRPTSAPNRANGPNRNDMTTIDDDDNISLAHASDSHRYSSPRTWTAFSNFRPAVNTLRIDSESAYRDYRLRVAELDATSAWRSRIAQGPTSTSDTTDRLDSLEAEFDAVERRLALSSDTNAFASFTERATIRRRLDAELQAVNASAARLLATGLETVEHEVSNASSRAHELAMATAQVNAERRRRLREANLRMPITSSSTQDSALTTRGEAVLAREQRERERTESGQLNIDTQSQVRDSSLQNLRNMRRGVEEVGRRTRTRVFRTADANSGEGLRTTGIAWGDASTVYVGTEQGIFELKLKFDKRKFRPAVEMR